MNIYWCYEMNEYSGLYIIEETRGKAKLRFAHETDDEYINVRSQIYRKNVNEKAGIIELEDTKLLNKYNLEYEAEEPPDNWCM